MSSGPRLGSHTECCCLLGDSLLCPAFLKRGTRRCLLWGNCLHSESMDAVDRELSHHIHTGLLRLDRNLAFLQVSSPFQSSDAGNGLGLSISFSASVSLSASYQKPLKGSYSIPNITPSTIPFNSAVRNFPTLTSCWGHQEVGRWTLLGNWLPTTLSRMVIPALGSWRQQD